MPLTKARKKSQRLELDIVVYRDYADDPVAATSDALRQYKNNVRERGHTIFRTPVPDLQKTIHGKLDVTVRALLVRKKDAVNAGKTQRLPRRSGASAK